MTVVSLNGSFDGGNTGTLVINGATLKVKGRMNNWKDIQISGAIISKPIGGSVYQTWDGQYHIYDNTAKSYASDIEITADSRKDPGLSYSADSYTYDPNESTHEWPVLNNPNGADASKIAFTSSDELIATVDATTGVVTPKAAGSAIISAVFDGDENYYPAAAK